MTAIATVVSPARAAETSPTVRDGARGIAAPRPAEPEDVVLLVPRVVLAVPARLLGMAQAPLQQGLRAIERHAVLQRIESVFVVASDESDPPGAPSTAVVLPTLTWSTFHGTELGVSALDDDIGGHGERVAGKVQLGTDGDRIAWFGLSAPRTAGAPIWTDLRWRAEDHRDVPFAGGAPVRELTFEESAILGVTLGDRHDSVGLGARGRVARLGGELGDATVGELGGAARFGLQDDALQGSLRVGRAEVRHGEDYVTVHGDLRGALEVLAPGRRLVLEAQIDATVGAPGGVPALDRPSLGGTGGLRGYPMHRFVGDAALGASLEYDYPVHEVMTAVVHIDGGEAAPSAAALFTDPDVHIGGGGGLRIGRPGRVLFEVDVSGGEGVQAVVAFDPLRPFAERRGSWDGR